MKVCEVKCGCLFVCEVKVCEVKFCLFVCEVQFWLLVCLGREGL